MDFWSKAKSFAEEAAKRSQELTKEAAKRSQELTKEAAKRSQELTSTIGGSSRIADIVSETAKRSKELAAEASNQIKAEALKRADQIKSLSLLDSSNLSVVQKDEVSVDELQRFGITDELREFVKEITMSTFQDFPLPGMGFSDFGSFLFGNVAIFVFDFFWWVRFGSCYAVPLILCDLDWLIECSFMLFKQGKCHDKSKTLENGVREKAL